MWESPVHSDMSVNRGDTMCLFSDGRNKYFTFFQLAMAALADSVLCQKQTALRPYQPSAWVMSLINTLWTGEGKKSSYVKHCFRQKKMFTERRTSCDYALQPAKTSIKRNISTGLIPDWFQCCSVHFSCFLNILMKFVSVKNHFSEVSREIN